MRLPKPVSTRRDDTDMAPTAAPLNSMLRQPSNASRLPARNRTQILGSGPGAERARKSLDARGARNFQLQTAVFPHLGHAFGIDAQRQRAVGSIRRRMAARAHHEHARQHVAVFGDYLMAGAAAPRCRRSAAVPVGARMRAAPCVPRRFRPARIAATRSRCGPCPRLVPRPWRETAAGLRPHCRKMPPSRPEADTVSPGDTSSRPDAPGQDLFRQRHAVSLLINILVHRATDLYQVFLRPTLRCPPDHQRSERQRHRDVVRRAANQSGVHKRQQHQLKCDARGLGQRFCQDCVDH